MKRKEQGEKRQEEILVAALDLFIRKGYAATKTLDISQAVGVGEGLLFHHFETKEKLYEELIRRGIKAPQYCFSEWAADPLTFFEQAAVFLLDAVKNQPFTAKMFVLMYQASYSEAASPLVKELLMQMDIIPKSIPFIKAGQENENIRAGDPHALSIAFWSAICGIAANMALMPDAPCPEPEWILDILRRKPGGCNA
jgi:AcrR family transcriptional regulator